MSRYEKIPMIEMADLNDLELLKTHRIYSDEFEKLPEERKLEIYKYCKLHATCSGCLASLEQIRYAVTKLYFGWPEKVDDTDSSSRKQYQRKAHLLRNRLGKIMAVYKNEHDDRRLAYNVYREMLEACKAMESVDNLAVHCAFNKYFDEEEELIQKIIDRFENAAT